MAASISTCERSKLIGGALGWIPRLSFEESSDRDVVAALASFSTTLSKGVLVSRPIIVIKAYFGNVCNRN
jgi:hypothetical protein